MNTAIVDDIHSAAVMADNLLSNGAVVFKAELDGSTGKYIVSWECENEGLYHLERDKQPDSRDNGD